MDSVRFDISARLPEGSTENQFPGMLQWMLLERFGLAAHTETRTLPIYTLTVAKNGPKMKLAVPESAIAPAPPLSSIERVGRTLDKLWSDTAEFGFTTSSVDGGNLRLDFSKMPMSALAQILASYLKSPVINRTSLEGNYQAKLEFSLPGTLAAAESGTPPDPAGNSLFATVQSLGLKLERRKGAVPVLVIDRVSRVPTPN
jgi:uncharacterized protein (TIGR03435 family)